MDPYHAAALLGTFGGLVILGVPISVGIGIAAFATLALSVDPGTASTTVAQRIATGLDRFTLLAIPFFILSGQFMNRGGIARRLIDFARALVGMLPGGLAYVTIVSSMMFGAISGSAVAAVAAVGGFMVPKMTEQGYDKSFGTAVSISSATTSLIIPPSNILIVYALASGGVSIAALFVAGYLPGILVGLALMAVAGLIAVRRGYPVDSRVSVQEMARRGLDALPSLVMVIIVIGGIIAGYFTATEAGAIAVLYSFILSVVVYREVAPREVAKILVDASSTTAIVMLLIGTSMGLSWVLAYERIPEALSTFLLSMTASKVTILLLINALLLLVGTVLDMTPAVLIFTPILLPVVEALGVEPLHFGIIIVLNLCIGLCTPPVGSVLFLGCSVSETRITDVSRALLPLYVAMVAALLLITFVPQISLALPRWFGL